MQIERTLPKDFLLELEERYHKIKPQTIDFNNQSDIDRLSDIEKSYLFDMLRLIDEIKTLRHRHSDFVHVLNNIPDHPLIQKVRAGRLKPEDKNGISR